MSVLFVSLQTNQPIEKVFDKLISKKKDGLHARGKS
jgi:hypothetical protein